MKQHCNLNLVFVLGFCLFVGTNLQAQEVSLSLHVDTAGTLSSKIDSTNKYRITNLTLTGELNGTDIYFIREMAGWSVYWDPTGGKLSVLDLSGAHMVAGGDAYLLNSYAETNAISQNMFIKCRALTSVILPNSVTSIGESAFSRCQGLTTLTIPDSVATIGVGAFFICTKLAQFIVGSGSPTFSVIDGVLFNKEKTCLLKYPEGKTEKNYVVPYGVTSIGIGAFEYNNVLVSVALPNSLTAIGDAAFAPCYDLTSITIPDSVTSIGYSAFDQCFYLTSVRLGASVTSIGGWAFFECSGLTEIHCKMKSAPTIISNVFYRVDKDNCKLYVPQGSYNSYRLTPVWGDFASIIEEDGTAVSITSTRNATVCIEPNTIVVKGIEDGGTVSVYSAVGALVKRVKATGGDLKIHVPANQLYLVKTTEETFKVVM